MAAHSPGSAPQRDGRLTPLPPADLADGLEPGSHTIRLHDAMSADLLVPSRPGRGAGSVPLVVMFHGAGGRADHMITILSATALEHGFLVLAPQSRDSTWDVIRTGYGPDVRALDEALHWVARRFPLDAARLAIGGFSDGASYALSLGLTNGDLFSSILAFSPGFAAPGSQHGHPWIFICHGQNDTVLPIERCGRPLARRLGQAGYEIAYHEFADGHLVPRDMVDTAVTGFLSAG